MGVWHADLPGAQVKLHVLLLDKVTFYPIYFFICEDEEHLFRLSESREGGYPIRCQGP